MKELSKEMINAIATQVAMQTDNDAKCSWKVAHSEDNAAFSAYIVEIYKDDELYKTIYVAFIKD